MNLANEVLWRRLGYMLSPQLDIYKHLASHLTNKRVLEVGFGTGIGVLQYAPRAKFVCAIEIDPLAVAFAKKCFSVEAIAWTEADILAFSSVPYDAIVMIEVLEHITDWEAALANVARLLDEDGRLYISARNANASLRKNDLHEREWTAPEFRNALLDYFSSVDLYDYSLCTLLSLDTKQTPLMAVARK